MRDLGRTAVVGGWHSVFWVVWLVLVGVVASFLFVGLGASYWSVFLPQVLGFLPDVGCVCW